MNDDIAPDDLALLETAAAGLRADAIPRALRSCAMRANWLHRRCPLAVRQRGKGRE